MSEVQFDNARGCVAELSAVNREIADFGHLWAAAAGELKEGQARHERLKKAALRGLIGEDLKVAEKDATAEAAVESTNPGLAEHVEALEGKVEEYKTLFKTLERRASNAQSILGLHRDEGKLGGYVDARRAA